MITKLLKVINIIYYEGLGAFFKKLKNYFAETKINLLSNDDILKNLKSLKIKNTNYIK